MSDLRTRKHIQLPSSPNPYGAIEQVESWRPPKRVDEGEVDQIESVTFEFLEDNFEDLKRQTLDGHVIDCA